MMRKQLLRSISRSPAVVSTNGSPAARTFATTARRQADVELTVDGKKVSVPGMEFYGGIDVYGISMLTAC